MPLRDTLARVDEDLAAGRVPVARQRLRGLVSSFPYDPTLRRRLAEVYRLYGEPAQAGRWMYLEEDRDAAETAAFEARYRTSAERRAALSWDGPDSLAPTDFAREQLAALPVASPESVESSGHADVKGSLAAAGCLVLALAFLAIWVIGVIALFR
ncbi:DUF6584 family protein [Streptomyces sp. NRRL F-2799]|uniref:DUF6584 family protein n=1 Tax=Streptomyces sp. NRRL F-2799 TaxID=1463844 RepID=UPI0004C91587|nr:DUF6584 family protein [Streptomyces sp. NRRL F-2799]